jgi:hypothetical protein
MKAQGVPDDQIIDMAKMVAVMDIGGAVVPGTIGLGMRRANLNPAGRAITQNVVVPAVVGIGAGGATNAVNELTGREYNPEWVAAGAAGTMLGLRHAGLPSRVAGALRGPSPAPVLSRASMLDNGRERVVMLRSLTPEQRALALESLETDSTAKGNAPWLTLGSTASKDRNLLYKTASGEAVTQIRVPAGSKLPWEFPERAAKTPLFQNYSPEARQGMLQAAMKLLRGGDSGARYPAAEIAKESMRIADSVIRDPDGTIKLKNFSTSTELGNPRLAAEIDGAVARGDISKLGAEIAKDAVARLQHRYTEGLTLNKSTTDAGTGELASTVVSIVNSVMSLDELSKTQNFMRATRGKPTLDQSRTHIIALTHEIGHHLLQFVDEEHIVGLKKQFEQERADHLKTLGRREKPEYMFTEFEEWFPSRLADMFGRDYKPSPNSFISEAFQHIVNLLKAVYDAARFRRQDSMADFVYDNFLEGKYNDRTLRTLPGTKNYLEPRWAKLHGSDTRALDKDYVFVRNGEKWVNLANSPVSIRMTDVKSGTTNAQLIAKARNMMDAAKVVAASRDMDPEARNLAETALAQHGQTQLARGLASEPSGGRFRESDLSPESQRVQEMLGLETLTGPVDQTVLQPGRPFRQPGRPLLDKEQRPILDTTPALPERAPSSTRTGTLREQLQELVWGPEGDFEPSMVGAAEQAARELEANNLQPFTRPQPVGPGDPKSTALAILQEAEQNPQLAQMLDQSVVPGQLAQFMDAYRTRQSMQPREVMTEQYAGQTMGGEAAPVPQGMPLIGQTPPVGPSGVLAPAKPAQPVSGGPGGPKLPPPAPPTNPPGSPGGPPAPSPKPQPPANMVDRWHSDQDLDGIITSAKEQTDQLLSNKMRGMKDSTVKKVLGVVDPSIRFARPIIVAMTARANALSGMVFRASSEYVEIKNSLRPFLKPDNMLKEVAVKTGRTAQHASPLIAGIGLGESEGVQEWSEDFLGISKEDWRTLTLLIGGAGTFLLPTVVSKEWMLDSTNNSIVMNKIHLKPELVSGRDRQTVIDNVLKIGGKVDVNRKLADILYNPQDYFAEGHTDLTPEQSSAIVNLNKRMDDALRRLNATELWAGSAQTLPRQFRGIQSQFEPQSLADVLEKYPETFPGSQGRPELTRLMPFQRERALGDNIPDVLYKYKGIKLAKTIPELIVGDLQQKAAKEANLIMAKALMSYSEGEEGGWISLDGVNKARKAVKNTEAIITAATATANDKAAAQAALPGLQSALAAEEARVASLGYNEHTSKWQRIPGFDEDVGMDVVFREDVTRGLRDAFPDVQGNFERAWDQSTSFIRTALFSADLSAWLTQGSMIMATNPGAFFRSAPTLLAASIFGDKFTAKWAKDNWNFIKEYAAAGGVTGRELDELTSSTAAKRVPVVHTLENRGFQNFVPVARIVMAKHIVDGDALLRSIDNNAWASKLGASDAARMVGAALQWGPMLAGLTAYELTNDDEETKWDKIMRAAILGGGGITAMGTSGAAEAIGRRLRTTPEARRASMQRVAREMNRSSGILNKGQLGIDRERARLERNLAFNSPAFTRNMLLAVKWALTPGAEGAMARAYLIKTAAVAAGIAAGAKLVTTGELDSFDPTDSDSVLNPAGFARANLGEKGKISVSNPLISLFRAVYAAPYVEGGNTQDGGLGPNEFWNPLSLQKGQLPSNLLQVYTNRMPVPIRTAYGVVGQMANVKDVGDFAGLAIQTGSENLVPLPVQALDKAANAPDINHTGEAWTQVLGSFFGSNVNPETLSQERKRITDQALRARFSDDPLFMGDVNQNGLIDLNDLPSSLREEFMESPDGEVYRRMGADIAAKYKGKPLTPESRYSLAMDGLKNKHVATLRRLEQDVQAGRITKLDFKKQYYEEATKYRQNIDAVRDQFRKDPSAIISDRLVKDPATGKAVANMNVVEYMDRNTNPMDAIVDGYYKLFDKAETNGQLDFELLDQLRSSYKSGLMSHQLAYLEERISTYEGRGPMNSEGVRLDMPTAREMKDVQKRAEPFWQQRDTYAGYMGYQSYDALKRVAMSGQDPIAKKVLSIVDEISTLSGNMMRESDPELDYGLTNFYGRVPYNRIGYITSEASGGRYDSPGTGGLRFNNPYAARLIGMQYTNDMDELSRIIAASFGVNYSAR